MVLIFRRRHRDFDEDERLALELLQPHLLRRLRAVTEAAEAAGALAALEDGHGDGPEGVILCSSGGVIEFASRRTRQTLEAYFGRPCIRLPDPLRSSIASARTPLIATRGDRTLTVRITRAGTLVVLLLDERDTRVDRLTRREREILARVALGETDAEIAASLGVAPATVGKHLEHIYERLGVHTRTGAAAAILSR